MFAAHEQKVTAQPQREIADQGIPDQRDKRTAEQCCRRPIARPAEASIALNKVPNLLRLLEKQANGRDLVQQGVCG